LSSCTGTSQPSSPVRKASLPLAKKPPATAPPLPAAAKQSKPAETSGKAPAHNGGPAKGPQKAKAGTSAIPEKGGDGVAGKKAVNGSGGAAAAAVARLNSVPEQENAQDATTDDFSVVFTS